MDSNNLAKSRHDYDIADYDIAVIGGGIAGLGVALEAVARGYSVVLVERAERLAQGTSANSLKIIHGGFRYLQSGAIARVLNSMAAQARLVRAYPELLAPLPCLMPLKSFGLRSRYPVLAATQLFRIFAKGLGWPERGMLPEVVRGAEDSVVYREATGSMLKWWDWQLVSHEAFVARLEESLRTAGGQLMLNALVVEIGSASKVAVISLENGTAIRARTAIDCRGSGVPSPKVSSFTTAFNLILRAPLDPKYGVALCPENRLLFAVPRPQRTSGSPGGAVGTWYIPGADPFSPERPVVTEAQISAALMDINMSHEGPKLTRSDVIEIEAGVLPCTSTSGRDPVVLLGRERIETHGRIVKVISTKYTTFQTQARWALDTAEDLIGPGSLTKR